MGGVVGQLHGAAAVAFLHQAADGVGDHIAEEHAFAVHMARGAACRLHQAGLVAQEAFLVRIEDAHQRDLRQVQALAE